MKVIRVHGCKKCHRIIDVTFKPTKNWLDPEMEHMLHNKTHDYTNGLFDDTIKEIFTIERFLKL